MSRCTAATAAVLLLIAGLTGCVPDLPSGPDEARDRLSRGETRTVSLALPFPRVEIELGEYLADSTGPFAGVLDPDDLSFSIEPDPIGVGLGSFLGFEAVEIEPVTRGYRMTIDGYRLTKSFQAEPLPVEIPAETVTAPLAPASSGSVTLPGVDFTSIYQAITIAGATASRSPALTLELTTDATSSLSGVSAALLDGGGAPLAESGEAIDIGPDGSGTLTLPLHSRTLPGRFDIRLDYDAATGTLTNGNLTARIAFRDLAVTGATGVAADRIEPVSIDRSVRLDVTTAEFTAAVIEAGTIEIAAHDFGDLVYSPGPASETDLAGKRVGGSSADELRVAGTVGPPAGAARVDITTGGTITLETSDLALAEITVGDLDFGLDESFDAGDFAGSELDGVRRAVVERGTLELEVTNRLEIGGTVAITLTGVQSAGESLSRTATIGAASGGSAATTRIAFDLAGATISPGSLGATVTADLAAAGVTITSAQAAEALVLGGRLDLEPVSVEFDGSPDLEVEFDRVEMFGSRELELGELSETLSEVGLTAVDLAVRVENGTGIPLELRSLALELVRGADRDPIRDDDGSPVRLSLVEAGNGGFTVPSNATGSLSAEASTFVTALLRNALDGDAGVGVRAVGRTGFGDAGGMLERGDSVRLGLSIHAPLDLELPADGVSLNETQHAFVDLDSLAADFAGELGESLVTGEFELGITNATPIGLDVALVLAPTPVDTAGFDPFASPDRFQLTGIRMEPARVDATTGLVTEPGTGTTRITIPGDELDIFERGELSLGLRLTITPPETGRVRITADDYIGIAPTARLELRVGPSAGTGGQE